MPRKRPASFLAESAVALGLFSFGICTLLVFGCAGPRRIGTKAAAPAESAASAHARGLSEGRAAERKDFARKYGALLKSCTSRDVVKTLNARLQRCTRSGTLGKEAYRRCLVGYKKIRKKADGCERDTWKELQRLSDYCARKKGVTICK